MSVVTQRYTFSGSGEDFGPRKGRRLVVLHTFEGSDPSKNTMRDAIAGATWQDRNDVLGSYNRLVAVDGVLGCVPDHRISGGINPASSFFKPRAWLYQHLPASVVNDPNSYALQLCAMGRRASYDANGWPPSIIDGFARSILEEEATAGPVVVANHADFQPGNRTDAGAIAIDLVMKRYQQIKASPEGPVADIDTFILETIRIDGNANIRSAPDDSASLLFKTASPSSALSVGTKNGFHAYWIDSRKAWAYTSTRHNVLSREPYQNTVEVIKEVPTGITQTQVNAARQATADKANAQMDAWTAARPKILP